MAVMNVPLAPLRVVGDRVREPLAEIALGSLQQNDSSEFEELFLRGDDEGLFGPDSVAWRVLADTPSLLIGGVAALMLQTLHPLAMAGVADHSDYRNDPFGRLRRTGTFVAATIYGSTEVAEEAIDMVRSVHTRVTGVSLDGRAYSAGDPDLVTWVHATEHGMFLRGYQRYAPHALTPDEADQYLDEVAVIAERLGAEWVPRSLDELLSYFLRVRPELYRGPQAEPTIRFLESGDGAFSSPIEMAGYRLGAAAAKGLLPRWAREMLGFQMPLPLGLTTSRMVVRPATVGFLETTRWLMGEPIALDLARRRCEM